MMDEIFVDEELVNTNESFEDNVFAQNEDIKPKKKFDDVVFNRKVKVFAKINNDGFITEINSDVFLKDTAGFVQIDEGVGDKFVYAQTMYFDNPIINEDGNYRYKV